MLRQIIAGGILLALLIAPISAQFATATESDYEISITGSIDTPSREVTIKDDTHTVSNVARNAPGETLSVDIAAPDDSSYDVYIYNGNRHIAESKDGTGDKTIEFDLTGYEPGSYLITLYKNGDYKDVYPLVVRGYEVSTTHPEDTRPEADVNVSVTLENVENAESPHEVKVIISSNGTTVHATASKQESDTYRAAVSVDDLPDGKAQVYAVVQGNDEAFKEGRKELLGISDTSSLAISQQTTTTEPPETTTTTIDSSTTTTTKTTSTTTSTITSPTASTIISTITSTSSPTQLTSKQATTRTTTTDSPKEQTTSSEIITPSKSTTPTQTTPLGPDVPGFGLGGSIVALLGLFLLLVRR